MKRIEITYFPKLQDITRAKITLKEGGEISFSVCQKVIDQMVTIPEGRIYTKFLELCTHDAIVMELAGALSIAALDLFKMRSKGKTWCAL